ncbi:beta-glucanase, partial [Streptomyces sp. NPDC058964]
MHEPTSSGPLPAPRTPPASDVVFTAAFASTRQWFAGRPRACPDGGPAHPDDDEPDHFADDDHCRSGLFRATRRADGWWSTGPLTTEGSVETLSLIHK